MHLIFYDRDISLQKGSMSRSTIKYSKLKLLYSLGSDQYCFIRVVKDSTVCTIPYVYEFNKDNTVTLNIANKVTNIIIRLLNFEK